MTFRITNTNEHRVATGMVERPECAIVAKRGGQPDTGGVGGSQG